LTLALIRQRAISIIITRIVPERKPGFFVKIKEGENFKYTMLEIDYSWDGEDFCVDSDGYGINLEIGYSF